MKTTISIPKELLTHIDVMNTMSGGIAQPWCKLFKFKDAHEYHLSVPGLDAGNLHAEVHNNRLTIYSLLTIPSQGMEIALPQVHHDKAIPYYVNIQGIGIRKEGRLLVVVLPLNELANGYHRDLTEE